MWIFIVSLERSDGWDEQFIVSSSAWYTKFAIGKLFYRLWFLDINSDYLKVKVLEGNYITKLRGMSCTIPWAFTFFSFLKAKISVMRLDTFGPGHNINLGHMELPLALIPYCSPSSWWLITTEKEPIVKCLFLDVYILR